MSNKHVNHQHGLSTMNASRPKSKLRKRKNKVQSKLNKAPLLQALHEARYGKKVKMAKTIKKASSKPKTSVKAKKATSK